MAVEVRDVFLEGKEVGKVKEKEMEAFRIDKKEGYEAWGTVDNDIDLEPNMDMGPNPYKIYPEMGHKIFYINKANDFSSRKADPNRNTYILSHGWVPDITWMNDRNYEKGNWTPDMAESILEYDPSAQILLIDWRKIAHQYTPNKASKWISSITDETFKALNTWGYKKDKTYVIGNSLGAILSQELSKKLGIVHLVGLDPAYSPISYEVDHNGAVFTGFDKNGACIVATVNIPGSETLASGCREKYLIKYNDHSNDATMEALLGNMSNDESGQMALEFTIDNAIDLGEEIVDQKIVKKVLKVVDSTIIVEVYGLIKGEETLIGAASAIAKNKVLQIPCLALAAAPGGILLTGACGIALDEVFDITAGGILRVAYKKHLWVPETYGEIVQNSIHNDHLTPGDIASRKGGGGSFFKTFSNKSVDGILYTEPKDPTMIKYLKTVDPSNSSYYTLYGTETANAFECRQDRSCIIYGGGGGDAYEVNEYSNTIILKDFKDNKNADKIVIVGNGSNSALSDVEAKEIIYKGKQAVELTITCGDCQVSDKTAEIISRKVILEEVELEEVEGWVDVAVNPENHRQKIRKNNPIITSKLQRYLN